jgi:two-component system, chemotaxis family, protein-glutamate methylesterase/glutaminase
MLNQPEIKVLIVEGNPILRDLLVGILKSDPRIRIVGTAGSGPRAMAMLSVTRPDLVLMDVELPDMDGYETTRQIMETWPVPIVVCATGGRQAITTFRLTEMGAVAGVQKPTSADAPDFQAIAAQLLQTVKLMSEVKVIRRWRRPQNGAVAPSPKVNLQQEARIRFVAIGASTGGPPVLRDLFAAIPKGFPPSILVVQHIAPGFLDNLVTWLKLANGPDILIAQNGQLPLPGCVYFAPDNTHMGISREGRIALSSQPPESGVRPSVAHLFRSLADTFAPFSVGILLTGMGRDGAAELKRMRDAGAFTIAQDQETSVVYGMPGEAAKLQAATVIVPSDKIGHTLVGVVNQPSSQEPAHE